MTPGRWAVLLRGVNVGGHRKVPMAVLKELLVDVGASDVTTHLNSGNAVGHWPTGDEQSLAQAVEGALQARLGLDVEAIVRSADDLAAVVREAQPLAEGRDPSRLLVTFFRSRPDPAAFAAVDPESLLPSRYWLLGRQLVTWHPEGVRKEPVTLPQWERRFATVGTARNWRTTAQLARLAGGA